MAQVNRYVLVWLIVLGGVGAPDPLSPVVANPLVAARKTRAPVPKPRPRAEVVVVVSGYASARTFNIDGSRLGDFPLDNVLDCVLSPDGALMAVSVREYRDPKDPDARQTYAVYVERTGTDRAAVGEPLAVRLRFPTLAWGGDGTLYVTELDDPPEGRFLRPVCVWAYDVVKRTAIEDRRLRSYCVFDGSRDGKRLLARRVVTEPTERSETVVLDAQTRQPVDVGGEGITWSRFFGADRLIGTRAKPNGAANETEHVIFDLGTKKAVPVGLPREAAGERRKLYLVFPAPDGKRLLYFWTEEVPPPPAWPANVPCQAGRLTIADPDGRNSRTIFKPEIKEDGDYSLNHIYSVDWK